MQHFALELDDRALSTAADGRVLTSGPSAVFDGTGGGAVGTSAWHELRLRPRAVSTRHLGAVLTQRGTSPRAEALVEAELRELLAQGAIDEGQRGSGSGEGASGDGQRGSGDVQQASGDGHRVPADAQRGSGDVQQASGDGHRAPAAGQPIWIVAPAQAEAAGLAALLGLTRRMGLRVSGFVDSATITAAALGSAQNTIVLELGLHHVAATAVDCDGSQARRRSAVLTERGGLVELYQMWLGLVSSTMVKRTRFDPLHDAATEQQAFDCIPDLALQAARVGSVTASISRGTGRFEADLTRDQFAQAAQPIYRAIVGLLHQLRPAGVPVAIVVPRLAVQLPGLREQLEQFVGCELVGVPDGFAAAATSLLDLPEAAAEASEVRLLRRLPVRPDLMEALDDSQARDPARERGVGAAGEGGLGTAGEDGLGTAGGGRAGAAAERALGAINEVSREPLGQRRVGGPAPSHVLWDGRAYAFHTDSLVVGRGQSNSRFITLPDGLAGVSRRHCTFAHDGDELVLLDHSTFGTFVNGERVLERVRIYAGDRVRLGEPGVELTLIAVGDGTR